MRRGPETASALAVNRKSFRVETDLHKRVLQSTTRVVLYGYVKKLFTKCFRAQPFRVPKLYLASTMVQQVDAKSLLLLKL
jgi:hypothetical protein